MNKKFIHIMLTGFLTIGLISCSDSLLIEPEANLEIYVLNDEGELIVPDSIISGVSSLYFANNGLSFFSVVYPGEKALNDTIINDQGNTLIEWEYNYDYLDIDKTNYVDKDGNRAVKGIGLTYQEKYDLNLSPGNEAFTYRKPGKYTIYLEAINTNEHAETVKSHDKIQVTVY